MIFLALNRHSKAKPFTYHAEIWSDKAGYYVYLPLFFDYQMDAMSFPKDIVEKTGRGFSIDSTQNRLQTKYTAGVAMMQMPFYLSYQLVSEAVDPFSRSHNRLISICAAVYLAFGILCLYLLLAAHFSKATAIVTCLLLTFGSHLYYYGVDETGMSHVYSFFLFSLLIYLVDQRSKYLSHSSIGLHMIIGMVVGLILLIRPTNLLFIAFIPLLFHPSKNALSRRLKRLLSPAFFLPFLFGVLLIILPQLVYWDYAFGSYLHYSYGKETFNFLDPQLLRSWFAARNGLFPYTPLYLIVIFILIREIRWGLNGFYLLLFVMISLLFSSWSDWAFGCAFGGRSYVEYLALFSLPLSEHLHRIKKGAKVKMIAYGILALLLLLHNLKLAYAYDGCFYGQSDWDWGHYLGLLMKKT